MIRRKLGFTLIELLIVVAIIAILAAIAVPNFLEAQVRSKLSRAQADMRSMATALETYRLDSTNYPPSMYKSPGVAFTLAERLCRLTTPLAYMTSLPRDVFNPGYDPISRDFSVTPPIINNFYTLGSGCNKDTLTGPNSYLYFPVMGPPKHLALYAEQQGLDGTKMKWLLFSYGPMRSCLGYTKPAASASAAPDSYAYNLIVYDPTNGTTSAGVAIRIGP